MGQRGGLNGRGSRLDVPAECRSSGEVEDAVLILPAKRKAAVPGYYRDVESGRLPAFKDRLDDVGGKEGEIQKTARHCQRKIA